MRVYTGSSRVDQIAHGAVLTIGNFDGLHLGHAALVRAVVERGRELGVQAGVYTFDPHPRRVLNPEVPLPRLMTWDQLVLGFEDSGIDFVVRETFTQEFSSLSAQAFVTDVIRSRIAPREIFVGRDFHFGKGAAGTGDTLTQIGPTLGIRVTVIPQVRAAQGDVSSSRIRELIGSGAVSEAAECLGHPYELWGTVVEGDRRGRTLGFPTANLDTENELIPENGVYATSVRIFDGAVLGPTLYPAVTNVGTRPTFEAGRVLTEAHLLDHDSDLYGQRIAVAFHARIRGEQKFPGPEALSEQIGRDADRARELLA